MTLAGPMCMSCAAGAMRPEATHTTVVGKFYDPLVAAYEEDAMLNEDLLTDEEEEIGMADPDIERFFSTYKARMLAAQHEEEEEANEDEDEICYYMDEAISTTTTPTACGSGDMGLAPPPLTRQVTGVVVSNQWNIRA